MADFTNKGFVETYNEMVEIIQKLTDKWNPTTSSEADPGVVLLKAFALEHNAQQQAFDMARNQGYLDSVTNKHDAYDLLHMLGYTMKQQRSATGKVKLLSKTGFNSEEDSTIPIFLNLQDRDSTINYFTTESLSDVSNNTEVNIMEGEIFEIRKAGNTYFTIKDIDDDCRFYLDRVGIAENGVFMSIYDAEENEEDFSQQWRVAVNDTFNLLDSREFVLKRDREGKNYIQFSKDVKTILGDAKFRIRCTYTRGEGGNVGVNTLIKAIGREDLVIIQDFPTINGRDEESIESAIQNYYKTQDVCNTIITKEDFEFAVNNMYLDRNKLCSLACITTPYVTQPVVKSFFKGFPTILKTGKGEGEIVLTALTSSQDYLKSYSQLEVTPEIANKVITELNSRQVMGTELSTSTIIERILAVLKIDGEVITYTEEPFLMSKIVEKLQQRFNSSELEFGKRITQEEVVNTIKSASNNIESVNIKLTNTEANIVLEEREGKITAAQKERLKAIQVEATARAILQGTVPLYKYLNRRNSRSKSLEGYLPLHLNTSATKGVYVGEEPLLYKASISKEAKITEINNGYDESEGEGLLEIQTLQENQVLQVVSEKLEHTREVSSGMRVKLVKELLANTPYEVPTGKSNVFKANTLFKKGTKLTLLKEKEYEFEGVELYDTSTFSTQVPPTNDSGQYSFDEDKGVWLKGDYIVIDEVVVGTAILKQGSIVSKGSSVYIDGENKVIAEKVSLDTLYRLKEGERLEVRNTTTGQGYFSREHIKPNFDLLYFNDSPHTLVGTQSISEYAVKPVEFKGIDGYRYHMNLISDVSHINLLQGYILQDGESFIVSLNDTLETIHYGSGTKIVATSDYDFPANTVGHYGEKEFVPLPVDITVTHQDITTYQSGTRYSILDDEGNPVNDVSINWKNLGTDTLKIYDQTTDTVKEEYTRDYSIRMPLVIISDSWGRARLLKNQSFKASWTTGSGESFEYTVKSSSDKDMYIMCSAPLYLPLALEGTSLSSYIDRDITISTFEDITTEGEEDVKYSQVLDNYTYRVDTESSTTIKIYFPLPLGENKEAKKILAHLTVENGAFEMLDKNEASEMLDIYSTADGLSVKELARFSDTERLYEFTPIPSVGDTSKLLNVDVPKNNKGLKVTVSKVSYVEDYSDEINYIADIQGNEFTDKVLDKFSMDDDTTASQVMSYFNDTNFDYLCEITGDFKYPTKAESYLHRSHPFNYRTINFISIPYFKDNVIIRHLRRG